MVTYIKKFSRLIIGTLTVLLACIVVLSLLNLMWYLIESIIKSSNYLLELTQVLHAFGLVLVVLIGVELMESIHSYISSGKIRIEAVLTLALIAISRKIIILEAADYTAPALIGIAAVIVALALAYFLIHKADRIKDS